MHDVLAVLSGRFVGFVLGLIGGGGSVVATPLLLYLVGHQYDQLRGARSRFERLRYRR